MKWRTLLLLAAVTLLAGLLAWSLQRDHSAGSSGQLLLPGLMDQLNEVAALHIEPAGAQPFRLERSDTGWRAIAAGGYPVDAGKVRRLLVRLAEARVAEIKTSNPALHDRLGVEMHDGHPGSGVLLRLEGVQGVPALLIGQRETRGIQGTYVRRADEPTALLVEQDLQPERQPVDWLEREIIDIPPEDVISLAIMQPGGESLEIVRDELGIFKVANLPTGRRLTGPTAAEALARALASLRLDEVRPAAGWDPPGAPTTATYRLRDGLGLVARSWTDGEEPWVAFSAEPVPVDGDRPAEAGEEARARAEALNARLAPWLYRVPAWKHEQLTRRLEDLLLPDDR